MPDVKKFLDEQQRKTRWALIQLRITQAGGNIYAQLQLADRYCDQIVDGPDAAYVEYRSNPDFWNAASFTAIARRIKHFFTGK